MESFLVTKPSDKIAIPIIKITGNSCNLRCGYCYYNGVDQTIGSIMSYELLEKFLFEYVKLFKSNNRLIFIWHGGEPLLAGIPFFTKIVEVQSQVARKNQEIQNSIQTNATLINDEWANFFKKHGFRIGVSLDGNRRSHNRFRQMYSNRGSFDYVMRGIKILRSHGIEPGIIQTLTADNLQESKENFNFFTKILGINSWGINIYNDVYNENHTMKGQSLTNNQFATFMIEQIDLWIKQENPHLVIREIENRICAIFGKKSKSCSFNGMCSNYFCVEHNGEIYPCDRSSGRRDLLLGNLSNQSLSEVLNGSNRLAYSQRVNNLPFECRSCQWKQSCNNGCAMHHVGSIDGKYYFCEAQKTVFDYLKSKLLELGYISKI